MSSASVLPSGVVTFMLTDIDGSTVLWDAHPTPMAAALEQHDAIIGVVASAHEGVLLKKQGEGDATVSVFQRASSAIAAAVALQEAMATTAWPDPCAIAVRVALHTGEAQERDGDYFGPTLNRAARLRSLINGGQIVLSEATAVLAHDHVPAGAELIDLGRHELRGLSRDERVFEVRSAGFSPATPRATTASAQQQLALPRSLALSASGLIAGRGPELATLGQAWQAAVAGNRQAAVLVGEPGIGKTRLAAEIAARAHAEGANVVLGRCDDGGGGAFQPFAQTIATAWDLVSHATRNQFGGELSRLAPSHATTHPIPERAMLSRSDPEAERYELFEGVVAAIADVSRARPTVLILDDIHWADKPTLLLLRHLLRAEVPMRLLVIATCRDTEIGDHERQIADFIADLRRVPNVDVMTVGGLDGDAISELVTASAGHELDDRGEALAGLLGEQTMGNPFFVGELLSNLVESGALFQEQGQWTATAAVDALPIPRGVRDVVRQRVDRLSETTAAVLATAAVVGLQFPVDLLESALGGDALEALEEATAAGLVEEEVAGRFAFRHALVRQTLIDGMAATRRARVHRRVADAIEARPDAAAHVRQLALHCVASVAGGADAYLIDRVITHTLAAARDAMERLAFEEAVATATDALAVVPASFVSERASLTFALVVAYDWLGNRSAGRQVLLDTADAARAIGRYDLVAEVASRLYFAFDMEDPEALTLMETALAALDEHDTVRRTLLMVNLARYRGWVQHRRVEGLEIARDALAAARALGDTRSLLEALNIVQYLLAGTTAFEERLALTTEMLELANLTNDYPLISEGLWARTGILLETCDVANMRLAYADLAALEEVGRYTYYSAISVSPELLAGDFAEAQRRADVLLERYGEGDESVLNVWSAVSMWVAVQRGEFAESEPLVAAAVAASPNISSYRAGLALVQAHLGMLDEAAIHVRALSADNLAAVPGDVMYASTIAFLAWAAALLGDVEAARAVEPHLALRSGLFLTIADNIVPVGPADRFLGMLAATRGDHDEAIARYEAAQEIERRFDAPPHFASTAVWLARSLLTRGAIGDVDRAKSVARAALEIAERLGMASVASAARELLDG